MKDKLSDALNEIQDDYIESAAGMKRRPSLRWIPAVAAVLAVALLVGILLPGGPGQLEHPTTGNPTHSLPINVPEPNPAAKVISLADYSLFTPVEAKGLATELAPFFQKSMVATLNQKPGENKAYSPANLYLALALLTELTGGEQELMTLLGADSLDALRDNANKLWNSTYTTGKNKTLLANSLWLDEDLQYDQEIMNTLSRHYFNSAYSGEMGSEGINQALRQWLNEQTGNLLQEQTKDIALDPRTVFALYSTLYYDVLWQQQYYEESNVEGIFHGTQDAAVTFMRKGEYTVYYVGSNFTAITSHLETGDMWLILPNEGVTPEEVAADPEYLQLVLGLNRDGGQRCEANIRLPKFDIQASSSLVGDLKSMGVSHIFEESDAFAGFVESPVGALAVREINQATRVMAHEMGITAANYVGIMIPGAYPPELVINFTLDRPFLFVVTNDADLPLFAGIVNDLS